MNMIRKSIITALTGIFALIPASTLADNPSNVLDLKHSITDSAVVYPESFEADTQKLLESWYMKNYTATDDRYRTQDDVQTSDAEIERRLSSLPTVIEMPFNSIVREYIDRYTRRGRVQVAALLGLGNYYLPIFEQALEAERLPLELKYLPVIESGLNPNAVSKHGATGLWQFMPATAGGLDLEVNSLVDERRDPYASSKAAARYLKNLFETYGDWSLAIAAYNCGPGAVNKAIRRAGTDPKKADFWTIYKFLSPETRGYFPMFIAANYVMNFYPKHNISPVLPTKPLVTDTIGVTSRIHFNQISKILDIPVEELRILNPQYRADLIPGSQEKVRTLILPSQQVHAYIMSEQEIRAFEAEKYARRTSVSPGELQDEPIAYATASDEDELLAAAHPASTDEEPYADNFMTQAAASGESPYAVARQRNSRNSNRTSETAHSEQQQTVPQEQVSTRSGKTQTASTRNRNQSSRNQRQTKSTPSKPVEHSIKSGETLTVIAKKYGVSVDELKRANNMSGDNIRAGKSLKIPAKSSSKSSSRSSSKRSKRRR